MPTPAGKSRNDDKLARQFKLLLNLLNRRAAHAGTVTRRQQTRRAVRNRQRAELDGTKHAICRARIERKLTIQAVQHRFDLFRLIPHDDDRFTPRLQICHDHLPNHRRSCQRQHLFELSHARRKTGGENDDVQIEALAGTRRPKISVIASAFQRSNLPVVS